MASPLRFLSSLVVSLLLLPFVSSTRPHHKYVSEVISVRSCIIQEIERITRGGPLPSANDSLFSHDIGASVSAPPPTTPRTARSLSARTVSRRRRCCMREIDVGQGGHSDQRLPTGRPSERTTHRGRRTALLPHAVSRRRVLCVGRRWSYGHISHHQCRRVWQWENARTYRGYASVRGCGRYVHDGRYRWQDIFAGRASRPRERPSNEPGIGV